MIDAHQVMTEHSSSNGKYFLSWQDDFRKSATILKQVLEYFIWNVPQDLSELHYNH